MTAGRGIRADSRVEGEPGLEAATEICALKYRQGQSLQSTRLLDRLLQFIYTMLA